MAKMKPPSRELAVETWKIERLIPYSRNPRTHTDAQVGQIAASIAEFGWTNPILAGPDGVIIAGHARLAAARKLQMEAVPVIVLDGLTEAQRRALVLADNRLALDAGWDADLLGIELEALRAAAFDVGLVGFTEQELERYLRQDIAGLSDPDDVPPEQDAVTVRGDIWVLDRHRLLCGDATVSGAPEQILEWPTWRSPIRRTTSDTREG
jgi:ParB-like chromosome segregation protein Spo0J